MARSSRLTSQGTGIWQIEPIGLGEADTKHVNPELCRGQLEFQAKIKMVGDKTGEEEYTSQVTSAHPLASPG